MRTELGPLDEVTVVDWADCGPLYYGEMSEDGERPILRPAHEAVILLTTYHGHVYSLPLVYGEDFARAERAAARIRAEGTVNLDKWAFVRVVYGSDAYVGEGVGEMEAAREREDAKFERWAA